MKSKFDSVLHKALEVIRTSPKHVQQLAWLVFLVGMHSLILGIFILFFTDLFYRIFFRAVTDNVFFIRQSGLFLICLGLFYLAPLLDIRKMHRLVIVIMMTKVMALLFLVTSAHYASWPTIIHLAAAGDGCMAILLFNFHRRAEPLIAEDSAEK